MREVKALLFDVFGTLVDWRSGVARGLAPFLGRHGIPDDPHDVADAWRRLYQPAMEAVRSGRRPFAKLDLLHRENLVALLREIGIEPSALPAGEIDELVRAWHRLDPWPDVVDGLRRLKTRYILAPLSNGNVSLMIDLARWGGLSWDAILGAEIARAYKPSPEAYLRTVALLDLAPGEACLVAAHNDDLAAARACGLKTAFIPRPAEHGPGQTQDLEPAADWDAVAPGLGALADRLGIA